MNTLNIKILTFLAASFASNADADIVTGTASYQPDPPLREQTISFQASSVGVCIIATQAFSEALNKDVTVTCADEAGQTSEFSCVVTNSAKVQCGPYRNDR